MHMLARAFADRIHSMDVDEALDQIQTKIHLAYKHSSEVLSTYPIRVLHLLILYSFRVTVKAIGNFNSHRGRGSTI